MTDDELKAIEARAEAATPGPWKTWEHYDIPCGNPYCTVDGCREDHASGQWFIEGPLFDDRIDQHRLPKEDADFIAASRQDIPALIAALRDSQKQFSDCALILADAHQQIRDLGCVP